MRTLPQIKANTPITKTGYTAEHGRKPLPSHFWHIIAIGSIIVLSLLSAILMAVAGAKYAILLLAVSIAIPTVIAIIAYPKFGIIVLLVSAYFLMWFYRMKIDFPLGTLMDGIQFLLILGFFLFQKFYPNWKIFKTPIAIMLLIWFFYNIFQFANPFTEARMAWVYTVRAMAVVTLMYFIFSYHIKTISFLKLLLKLWIGLSFFAALYAFKQEHIGFFAFEEADFSDPLVISLLFINGVWRKFSIFSDPVAFAYNMVVSTIFCVALITGPISKMKKIILCCLAVFFITNMLYSATRAAYVLLPAGFFLYIVMHLTRKVLTLGIIGAAFLYILVYIPTGNLTLYRFQSAFKPSDDASFNVRKINQKKIQPYILSHPLGGGLGATGASGVKYAPHSFLAQLPPDSTYIRVAAELGWIGLLIFCGLLFTILRQGIINYYLIKDPELKSYCLGMTLVVFALNIGCFPQEALVQFPISIYFYFFISVINITLKLDQEKQAQQALAS
ncbi:MAG: O-antigen ligase family protein [Pyrinomonadaceae bacterium]|nr:O-antigen ligase family protein [Sphingobacteriaceae bacterium]